MVDRSEPGGAKPSPSAQRMSDCEVVVRRIFDAPAHLVFAAWTRPELFRQWWVPKSIGLKLLSLDQDVRVGGTYRLLFDLGDSRTAAFFGTYTDVTPPSRLSWTNEEVDARLQAIMQAIHKSCLKYGTKENGSVNYVDGANIAGFVKVADAMLGQGVI